MSEQVLVLAPSRADGELCRRLLDEAGLVNEICADVAALRAALERPVAVLVVTEESLETPAAACIQDYLAKQPAWSAVPVIVVTGPQAKRRLGALDDRDARGHVTLLERPIRRTAFIGTLRLALQGRQQQYRIRDLLTERSESDRRRDQLLARIGHELRNPLAVIVISADVLETLPQDSEQARFCRSAIGAQARQMTRLLDDLSDVSRINRRKLALEREPVDLRQVLGDVVGQLAEQFETRRQRLQVELQGPRIPLLADPTRLGQVFTSLLTNASRYSPEGGEIRVRLDTGDGSASVSVRDNGAGLSEEALQHIFEPFYQAEAEGFPHTGLGIGLTLAGSLVKLHAGTITAHSAGPGCGSEFIVTLPLPSQARPAAGADRPR
jgi:signal transduction histidine kinase